MSSEPIVWRVRRSSQVLVALFVVFQLSNGWFVFSAAMDEGDLAGGLCFFLLLAAVPAGIAILGAWRLRLIARESEIEVVGMLTSHRIAWERIVRAFPSRSGLVLVLSDEDYPVTATFHQTGAISLPGAQRRLAEILRVIDERSSAARAARVAAGLDEFPRKPVTRPSPPQPSERELLEKRLAAGQRHHDELRAHLDRIQRDKLRVVTATRAPKSIDHSSGRT